MQQRLARTLVGVAAALVVSVGTGTAAVGAEPEWNVARVGGPASAPGVVVAVVDTGVDATHPALAGRVLPAVDVAGSGAGDANGHGTHVAGTIAGADAGCGGIGLVPDATVLPVKVLDAAGEGTVTAVADGIRRAADAGAAVINLSLGTDVVLRSASGADLRGALDHAWSKGAIPVLAAGNGGILGGLLGSGYGDAPAVVVTATDHQDRVAPYATSIGSARWGLAAPGGDGSGEPGRDVLSAYPDRRCALNAGTSMAAPHVSGALAALRSRGLSPDAAVQRVLATARDLGARGVDGTFGHGLLDLAAALGGAAPARPSAPAPGTSPVAPASPSPAPTGPSPAPAPPAGKPPTGSSPPPTGPPSAPTAAPVDASTTTRPGRAGDEDALAGPRRDTDRDRPPTGIVVAAVATLGLVSAAGGVAARRLRR